MYYFYDTLHGLRVLTKLGFSDDERIRDATHLLLSKRSPNGTGIWKATGSEMEISSILVQGKNGSCQHRTDWET
jgi:hypothetical protein